MLAEANSWEACELLTGSLCAPQIQQILCGGTYFGIEFPGHPRQLERRKQQSWGLRVKRGRDEDSDCDVENTSMLCAGASAELVHFDANATWKRKRRE